MKKRFLRLSKRILILTLCTTLLSGSVINRYKITANATSIVASIGAYGASEICVFLGNCLLALLGIGATAEVYQNRDTIAQLGKDFIDSLDLDEVSGWMLTKVDTTGQSYVYGTEALKEIQDMEFTVIQGGNNMPENNNDNDDDGDIDADDRTKELEQMGMWATTYLVEIMEDGVKPLIEGIRNGEENILSEPLGLNREYFDGLLINDSGQYVFRFANKYYFDFRNDVYTHYYFADDVSTYPVVGVLYEPFNIYYFYKYTGGQLKETYTLNGTDIVIAPDGSIYSETSNLKIRGIDSTSYYVSTCIPLFNSESSALAYLNDGDLSDCINVSKVYQIADWLQEHWSSALEQLNTGIRSLSDNMLIVGEAANQALINQSNGLGYIEDLGNRIATTAPLALPDSIADPIYYPATSPVPELAPEELPWNNPISNPDSPEEEPPYDPDIGEVEVWKIIHGTDTFGLNTLFGSLILLIMILIMLLLIFLSCLAFIIMIFRIPAQTGFLPEEMIAGLDYIKTLEIPGFGMSVYAFFMALIYIILVFTVIGILRKNIDKIKFPRKGRRS